jgi:hypothetical protein
MKSTMLQYDNAVEQAVERLLQMGIFKSKADIFRIGAMELACKYGAVKSKDEIIEEMMMQDAQTQYKNAKSNKGRFYNIDDI